MSYEEKKMVGILSTHVPPSIALNVIGHLSISIGRYADSEIMGKPTLIDKSGVTHLGISQFPFILTMVKPGKLKQTISLAKSNPNLLVADYPKDMLDTRTDEELAYSLASKTNDDLEYLGAILYGPTMEVDKITGKFQLWNLH